MTDPKLKAIASYCAVDTVNIDLAENSSIFHYGDEEYLVLTDDEAEREYDDHLTNYVDELILPEIPEQYHLYFDENSWKDDARANGSRGDALSSYDGREEEVEIDGTTYYIYRLN